MPRRVVSTTMQASYASKHARARLHVRSIALFLTACGAPATQRQLPSLEPDVPTLLERHRVAESACSAVVNPFFFRVEKGSAASYVLGTRHTSVPLTKLPVFIVERLRASTMVVAEVAPDDGTWTRYPRLDLPQQVGAVSWRHYIDLVGRGADRAREIGRPDAALAIMTLLFEDTEASMDRDIAREATSMGIPIRGLESAKSQHDLLERLIDVRLLRALIDHTNGRLALEAGTIEDLRNYCNGTKSNPRMSDGDRERLLASGYATSELDAIDEQMVFARTAAWVPIIEALLDEGSVFVAIGLDHLLGERGLIALLSAHGYVVTRVSNPSAAPGVLAPKIRD